MCEKRILTSMAAYLGYPTKIISLVLVRIHPTITQLKYGRLISTDSSTIRMVCLRSIMTHNPVITDLDLKKIDSTKKYLGGGLGKWYTSVKQSHKYNEKFQKEARYLNN